VVRAVPGISAVGFARTLLTMREGRILVVMRNNRHLSASEPISVSAATRCVPTGYTGLDHLELREGRLWVPESQEAWGGEFTTLEEADASSWVFAELDLDGSGPSSWPLCQILSPDDS